MIRGVEAPDSEHAGSPPDSPSPGDSPSPPDSPSPGDKSCWQLKPLQVSALDGNIEVTPEGVTLGRSESNSVMIPEAGFPYVSSSH